MGDGSEWEIYEEEERRKDAWKLQVASSSRDSKKRNSYLRRLINFILRHLS